MDRTSPEELISAYFDGETTPEENVVVERLLADSRHRQALEEYRHLREELQAIPVAEPSAEWSRRLRDRLAKERPAWAERIREPEAASAPSRDGKVAPAAAPFPPPAIAEGRSSNRSFWLAAGVGLAAGTLGIFVGWFAQGLRVGAMDEIAWTESVDHAGAPAPEASSGSADFPANVTFEAPSDPRSNVKEMDAQDAAVEGTSRLASELVLESRQPEASEFARKEQPTNGEVEAAERLSRDKLAEAVTGDATFRRTEGVVRGATEEEALAEKQRLADAFADVPRQLALAREKDEFDGSGVKPLATDDFAATYVGLWYETNAAFGSRSLETSQAPSELPAIDAPAPLDASRSLGEELKDGGAVVKNEAIDALARLEGSYGDRSELVIEGSPELVADALEALSRSDAGAEVRLLARYGESTAPFARARRMVAGTMVEELEAVPMAGEPADAVAWADSDKAEGEAGDQGPHARDLARDGQLAYFDAYGLDVNGMARIDSFFRETDDVSAAQGAGQPPGERRFSYGTAPATAGGFGFGGYGGGAVSGGALSGAPTPLAQSAAAPSDAPTANMEIAPPSVAMDDVPAEDAPAAGIGGAAATASDLAIRGAGRPAAPGVRGPAYPPAPTTPSASVPDAALTTPAPSAPEPAAMISPTPAPGEPVPPPPAPAAFSGAEAGMALNEPRPFGAPAPAEAPSARVFGKEARSASRPEEPSAMKSDGETALADESLQAGGDERPRQEQEAAQVWSMPRGALADRAASDDELREQAAGRESKKSASGRVRVILLSPEAFARFAEFDSTSGPASSDLEPAAEATPAGPLPAAAAPAAPSEP